MMPRRGRRCPMFMWAVLLWGEVADNVARIHASRKVWRARNLSDMLAATASARLEDSWRTFAPRYPSPSPDAT